MQPPQRKEHTSNALRALDLFFQLLPTIEDGLLSEHGTPPAAQAMADALD